MTLLARLERQSRPVWAIVTVVLVFGVGVLDVLTGYELSFSLFYLLPVSLAAWSVGKLFGITTAVVCALVWFYADESSGHFYTNPAIPYWNTGIRFGVFLTTSLLMSALRRALDREQELARVDNLTGAVNKRFFRELLQMELARSQRFKHPLTLAYMDLDNFKSVNDRLGHGVGDEVLAVAAQQIKNQLRKTDVLARLGGDEFAILLPEADGAAAKAVVTKVQDHFLGEMRHHGWPVTLSIGVLTCMEAPANTDELLKHADALMYTAKNQGKNAARYSVYTGEPGTH